MSKNHAVNVIFLFFVYRSGQLLNYSSHNQSPTALAVGEWNPEVLWYTGRIWKTVFQVTASTAPNTMSYGYQSTGGKS
jgi:hypothetical protein